MADDDDTVTAFAHAAATDTRARRKFAMPGWLKMLLLLCGVAVAGGAYLYVFDPQLGRQLLSGTPLAPPAAVTRAYKWRDQNGNWQLTDEPPPAGTRYERLETRSGDNIVPALPATKK